MTVTRSLSAASWRRPSEMARTANFVPEYAGTIFLVLLMPSLNYESRCKAIPATFSELLLVFQVSGYPAQSILAASRRRLDLDTLRPWSFDFPPESCAGRISGDAKYLGNFPPIKSSATRAKHGSTLIRKIATSVVQTRVGELRTTKFHRIAPQLCGEQLGDTRMGRADEGDSRHTGVCVFSVGTCGRDDWHDNRPGASSPQSKLLQRPSLVLALMRQTRLRPA